jgi:STAS domain-containing protein
VCAYDTRLFEPGGLRRFAAAHPGTAASAAPYDPACSLRAERIRRPWGLRLTGTAGPASRDALRVLVAHLFDDAAEVTVDLSGLGAADTAAGRMLVGAASGGRGRLHLVGCSPSLRGLLAAHGAAAVPGLTFE